VLELAMTTFCGNEIPTIVFEKLENITNFHSTSHDR
jgi:hypothetical protein